MHVADYYSQPHINLTGIVGEKMLEDLDRQVKATIINPELQSEAATHLVPNVVVTLSTGGGSVGFARAIYEELCLLQGVANLTLVARGLCLSAGVTVAMAIPAQNRYATPNTKFLIHEGSRNDSVPFVGSLRAREIQEDVLHRDMDDDRQEARWVMGLIAKGCGQKLSEVRRQTEEGLWLVGRQAVEFGLIKGLLRKPRVRRGSA